MPKTAPAGYSRLQIRLHWAVVILILLQFLFHEGVADAFERGIESGAMTLTGAAIAHFVGGSLVFLLAIWRLMLRSERGVPALPDEDSAWQRLGARATHAALYGLLLILPVTGGVAWALGLEGAGELHETLFAVLMLATALHVAGALYGHFLQGTGIIDRMRRPDI